MHGLWLQAASVSWFFFSGGAGQEGTAGLWIACFFSIYLVTNIWLLTIYTIWLLTYIYMTIYTIWLLTYIYIYDYMKYGY